MLSKHKLLQYKSQSTIWLKNMSTLVFWLISVATKKVLRFDTQPQLGSFSFLLLRGWIDAEKWSNISQLKSND